MRLIVGAPVGPDRHWALPLWFDCLRSQTRPPDEYVFLVNDGDDKTVRLLRRLSGVDIPQLSYAVDRTAHFIPRYERNQHDVKTVYGEFARRRNQLREMVLRRQPDVFFSLDSDVMLEDPYVIERLLQMLHAPKMMVPGEPDVVAPSLFLHATGYESECYNAAWWWPVGDPDDPQRPWKRASHLNAAEGTQLVDIPLAAVMMRRAVLERCEYRYHACGEDLGFAQDLERHGFRCLWMPALQVRHVMSEAAL